MFPWEKEAREREGERDREREQERKRERERRQERERERDVRVLSIPSLDDSSPSPYCFLAHTHTRTHPHPHPYHHPHPHIHPHTHPHIRHTNTNLRPADLPSNKGVPVRVCLLSAKSSVIWNKAARAAWPPHVEVLEPRDRRNDWPKGGTHKQIMKTAWIKRRYCYYCASAFVRPVWPCSKSTLLQTYCYPIYYSPCGTCSSLWATRRSSLPS